MEVLLVAAAWVAAVVAADNEYSKVNVECWKMLHVMFVNVTLVKRKRHTSKTQTSHYTIANEARDILRCRVPYFYDVVLLTYCNLGTRA